MSQRGCLMKFKSNASTSLLALSRALAPVVVGLGATCASSAAAQSVCTPNLLGIVVCTGTPATPLPTGPSVPVPPAQPVLELIDRVTPISVVLEDGFESPDAIILGTLAPGADIDIGAVGTAVIDTVDQPGLLVDSAGRIDAQVSAITTEGTGATGALLRAVDDVIFVTDGTVSTLGDAASALDIAGRSVDVTANVLRTSGTGAGGAILNGVSGPVNLTADLIETNGGLSDAALIRAAGDATLQGGVLRTRGTDALAFSISNDAAACVLLGNNGCATTVGLDEVTTEGFGGIGGLVRAAGSTAIDIGVLRTGGDQAAGLDLSTDPQACILIGVGGCGTAFTVQNLTTNGARSPGALVRAGGPIAANVGVLETAGDQAVGLDLASQPEVCAVVGAGNCGTSFSVGQLTTGGAGATGILGRIAGPTTGNVGVLRTNGNDAAGIDLAADPIVCAIVGAGACDVSLVGQDISTRGDGAAAVLIDAVGNVTTNLGALTTLGNGSTGLGIATDPVACLALGPGRCGINATTGPVNTGGDDAPGVDVDGGGDPVVVGTGPVDTGGNTSPGVVVTNPGPTTVTTGPVTTGGDTSPGVVVDGSGGTGPTTVTTGPVTTGGGNSPGVVVDGGSGTTTVTTGPVTTTGNGSTGVDVAGTGPIVVDTGPVTTGGATSPGIDVDGGAGPITVRFDDVTTRGPDSPGVDVSGTGPITIEGGNVTTTGDRSDGVTVGGGAGPVIADVDRVTVGGAGSDGVVIGTTTGGQQVTAGPITVTGLGGNGIVATAGGCGAIDITARDDISAAQGAGIVASSGCTVRVTTLPGATVTGRTAAIDVTSGTGSTITIGDIVSATAGPAINVNGAAAAVTIAPTGSVVGTVDLTDASDTLVNNGLFSTAANSSFGAGADSFVNRGRVLVRPGATAAGSVTFTGLESFANNGSIDLRNGVAGDTLTLPGSFAGTGASSVGLDVSVGLAGAIADRLVVSGAATGSTVISLAQLASNPNVLVNNLVLVDAGANSAPTAFTLASALPAGLVRYDLGFDAATGDYALFGTPDTAAYRLAQLGSGARELFYRTNDAVSGHLQEMRGSGAGMGDDVRERSSALWGQMFGSADRSTARPTVSAFGQSRTVVLDNVQDFFGGQIGYDMGAVTGRGTVFGVTAGYAGSTLGFRNSADRLGYEAVNGGVYAGVQAGAFFLNGIARYQHYWMDVIARSAGLRRKLEGDGYGGKVEAGVRLGSGGVFVEPGASIEYVHTDLDRLDGSPAAFTFDDAEGLRGKAGGRLGWERMSGASVTTVYLSGHYVHEFEGDGRTAFASGGQTVNLGSGPIGDYGRGTIGFSVLSGTRVSGFVEAFGDYGDNYKGGGARGGLSIRF